ncbi:hypothetical protein G6F57_021650 [Rhizopus arrhizus]|nr:hypothetical protein G6F57_021650 [Rhizopus arrhizus]
MDMLIEDSIVNPPEQDFPSLVKYLSEELGGKPLDKKAIVVANDSSSSEDESEEEDPSKIDCNKSRKYMSTKEFVYFISKDMIIKEPWL